VPRDASAEIFMLVDTKCMGILHNIITPWPGRCTYQRHNKYLHHDPERFNEIITWSLKITISSYMTLMSCHLSSYTGRQHHLKKWTWSNVICGFPHFMTLFSLFAKDSLYLSETQMKCAEELSMETHTTNFHQNSLSSFKVEMWQMDRHNFTKLCAKNTYVTWHITVKSIRKTEKKCWNYYSITDYTLQTPSVLFIHNTFFFLQKWVSQGCAGTSTKNFKTHEKCTDPIKEGDTYAHTHTIKKLLAFTNLENQIIKDWQFTSEHAKWYLRFWQHTPQVSCGAIRTYLYSKQCGFRKYWVFCA
jgi:hypothetical protein